MSILQNTAGNHMMCVSATPHLWSPECPAYLLSPCHRLPKSDCFIFQFQRLKVKCSSGSQEAEITVWQISIIWDSSDEFWPPGWEALHKHTSLTKGVSHCHRGFMMTTVWGHERFQLSEILLWYLCRGIALCCTLLRLWLVDWIRQEWNWISHYADWIFFLLSHLLWFIT